MLSRTLRKGGSTGAHHEASVGITSVIATTPKPSPTEPPSCHPAPMQSSAFAPTTAPSRTVVGPFVTAFGFRSWYWVCVPDAIIAVPQGFWTGAALANSDSSGRRVRIPLFWVALMVKLISGPGRRLRKQIPARLENVPDSQLQSRPNIITRMGQVRSISIKRGKLRVAVGLTPDVILETIDGKKLAYGIGAQDYDEASARLRQMYPNLCKSF